MSSNWPDKPLIRIIRGNIGYKDVSGGLALAWAAEIIAQEETGEGEDR